ncbi:hypothetical protein MSSIT_1218 [Methanosarcina siciliae T4/M]|uniref:Uncharacterized protein n=1 Tax=Methanosarcina siciliae T4/M TaxID=1434120 RepID=A0A0E3P3E3_9EURY|nr:hypothetical protein [Methanosarcina siciliae]AKB27937.1 hypothetical protein MSSIT_1218 [Methanosarcina siciliae T4/M]
MTQPDPATIFAMAMFIKSRCDGAIKKDYVGYNAPEAAWFPKILGKWNAEDAPLSMVSEMHYRLRKYRKQLSERFDDETLYSIFGDT